MIEGSRRRRSQLWVGLATVAWVCLLLWSSAAMAREVPPLTGRVVDEAGVLSASQARALTQRLEAYEQKTGRQFAVLIVDSLEGEPLEAFSIEVVDAWALGDEALDDGLLVLLAVQEHKVRIEVGYGLEGDITDLQTSEIIHETMRPQLRNGRYGAALRTGVDELIAVAGGPAVPPKADGPSFWTKDYYGHPGFWYVAVGTTLLLVFGLSLRWPLVAVIGLLGFGKLWWPGALVCILALYIRWRLLKRRVRRDGYGSLLASQPERPGTRSSGGWLRSLLWKVGGLFSLLAVGRMLTSRSGQGLASGAAKAIGGAGRGLLGGGGRFGGGGASGGW